MHMIATIHLFTPDGRRLVSVEAHDVAPFVRLALRGRPIDLTRDQARQVGDALRAAALTAPVPDGTEAAREVD